MANNLALVEFAKAMPESDRNEIIEAFKNAVLPDSWQKIKTDA